ncbi:unnamed protein product, partial [Durusdinium trenchii]
TLLHNALMNLGFNPWTAPEDHLQLLMFHFSLSVEALKDLLVRISSPPWTKQLQSKEQYDAVSKFFRSRARGGETPSAGGQSGARYPLLESRNFHRILTEEVSQHLSPAVLRVLGVARGIQICQEDPRAPFRAARQLPDALFADLERNAYRVLGCQMHCLRRSFRQEVRVVDMLQSDGPCPCKMVASCSDSLYEHCKANALPSRSATGRWMARCWLHCAKGWPREATYDPDTAQIIAEEFVAHKFEVTDFTMKVLVDLTNLGYEEGPMLFLNAVNRHLDISSGLEHLLHCAAQQCRSSLVRFALRLGAEAAAKPASAPTRRVGGEGFSTERSHPHRGCPVAGW